MRAATSGTCGARGARIQRQSGSCLSTAGWRGSIRTRSVVSGLIDRLTNGAERGVTLAGAEQLERVRVDDAIPEIAASVEVCDTRSNFGAQFRQERKKIAIFGTEVALDAFAQAHRERRRYTVGGDGDGQIAIAMEGAEAEPAMLGIIDGIAQDVAVLAKAEDLRVAGKAGDDQKAPGEIKRVERQLPFRAGSEAAEGFQLGWDLRMIANDEALFAGEIKEDGVLKIHFLLFWM